MLRTKVSVVCKAKCRGMSRCQKAYLFIDQVSVHAMTCLILLQVRQKLYNTAVGKWRNYEEQLQPVVTDLHEYVERYEAGLGGRQAHDEL